VSIVRNIVNAFRLSAGLLAAGLTAGQAADVATGSGIFIGPGEVLTNAHVVEDCRSIKLTFVNGSPEPATVIARDEKNDLAVLHTRKKHDAAAIAAFRESPPLRTGDSVVALGYPLSGVLATGANLTVGNVSALAGIGDDSRYIQMSAPVQPGNSGGPLVDTSGHVVGIVSSKLDAMRVARAIGDIPQNVNFALKADVARTFLDSKLISYKVEASTGHLSAADVGEAARPFTVYITCNRNENHVVAVAASPPAPKAGGTPAPPPKAETSPGYLKGPLRDAFVKKSIRSCDRRLDKDQPDVSRTMVKEFCSCVAEGEADTLSEADLAYMDEHHKASDDFAARFRNILAACKKKIASR
jgi:S1-C subfamily serine protease